jgi:hypothetical protein
MRVSVDQDVYSYLNVNSTLTGAAVLRGPLTDGARRTCCAPELGENQLPGDWVRAKVET